VGDDGIRSRCLTEQLSFRAAFKAFECRESLIFYLLFCAISVVRMLTALKIHMSENAHDAVAAYPEFITAYRGQISIKVETVLYLLCSYTTHSQRVGQTVRQTMTQQTAINYTTTN